VAARLVPAFLLLGLTLSAAAAPPPPSATVSLWADAATVGTPFVLHAWFRPETPWGSVSVAIELDGLRILQSHNVTSAADATHPIEASWTVVADQPGFWRADAWIAGYRDTATSLHGFSGRGEAFSGGHVVGAAQYSVNVTVASDPGGRVHATTTVLVAGPEWLGYAQARMRITGDPTWTGKAEGKAGAPLSVILALPGSTQAAPAAVFVEWTVVGQPDIHLGSCAVTGETNRLVWLIARSPPYGARPGVCAASAGRPDESARDSSPEWPGTTAMVAALLAAPTLLLVRRHRR